MRSLAKMTQNELAKLLKISDKAVSKWENDNGKPDLEQLISLSQVFNVTLDYILNGIPVSESDKQKENAINSVIKSEVDNINLKKMINDCIKKLEKENVKPTEAMLPKIDESGAAFASEGVFVFTSGAPEFKLEALLNLGLGVIALRHFREQITFDIALLCDDILIYRQAIDNYKLATNGKRKMIFFTNTSEKHDINWALENLNPKLPRYFHVVAFLIENGAFYLKQYGLGYDVPIFEHKKDLSKTNFFYRMAKELSKAN